MGCFGFLKMGRSMVATCFKPAQALRSRCGAEDPAELPSFKELRERMT